MATAEEALSAITVEQIKGDVKQKEIQETQIETKLAKRAVGKAKKYKSSKSV